MPDCFLCNRCMEFDEAWQEAKTKSPLLTLCFFFSGQSENKYGRHGFWFTGTFFTFCLQLLNGIWLNLIESKYLTSSTKFKVGGGCEPWLKQVYILSSAIFLRDRYSNNGGWWYSRARNKVFGPLGILYIMLLKYGDNGSKCEFRNARSAFSKIRKVASLSCMPTAVL